MSKYDDLIGRARTHVGECVIGEFSLFGVEYGRHNNFDIISTSRVNYFPTVKFFGEKYFFLKIEIISKLCWIRESVFHVRGYI